MSDEEYFNEMMTSEETIPAIRNDRLLRNKLVEILEAMTPTMAREICEHILDQLTHRSVTRSRKAKEGDSFTVGWGMISRGKDIELTIRRDTLIYEGVHTELEDGRQVMKIDISLEDVVNLLNQDVALIEVKGQLSKSGAQVKEEELREKYEKLTKESNKILIPIREEREDSRYDLDDLFK